MSTFGIHKHAAQIRNPVLTDAVDRFGQDCRKVPGLIMLPRAILMQHSQAHNGKLDFPIRQDVGHLGVCHPEVAV